MLTPQQKERKKEYMKQYYLEHDGKNRTRIDDVEYAGEKNSNWKGGLVIFICEICGKEKWVKKKDLCHSKYCSLTCSNIGRHRGLRERAKQFRIKKNCIVCGKELLIKPSHADKAGTYCSKRCMKIDYQVRFKDMTYDRVDANQGEIIDALEAVGATVVSLTRVKSGCPDICVGFRGINYLFEIKVAKGTLTDAEKKFFQKWLGNANIIRSPEEALAIIGAL